VPDLFERAWPLLGLLYAAPGDVAAASRFVEALCKTVSDGACAVGLGRAREEGLGPLVAFRYRDRRTAEVPLALPIAGNRALDALGVGTVFELRDDPAFAASPLFGQLLAPLGVETGPGLGMVLDGVPGRADLWLLLLPARRGWMPAPADRELLDCLAPHIRESLRLHARVTDASTNVQALVAAFDHLALGVILMDAKRRVSFANRSADEILGIPPGGAGPAQRVEQRTEALARLLIDQRSVRRGSLMLRHPEDGRPLQLFFTPFDWPASSAEAGRRYSAALFIGDPKRLTGDPVDVLIELYSLTPSEARLALLLTTGRSVEESASELGIALSTARSVLKAIFAKTGTRRQADLVRMLLIGPGALRPEPPEPRRRRPAKGRGTP
jgi:DNA-binding CsgD family transcriptional regulator